MRPLRLAAWPVLAVLTCLAAGRPAAQAPAFSSLLDRYHAGHFDAAIAEVDSLQNLDDLLAHLKEHGPAWIAAGGEPQRARRELAAASFALEAARTRAQDDWKWIQRQPTMSVEGVAGSYQPPDVLYWRAPPLLIEWGCTIVRARTDRLEAVEPKPADAPARTQVTSQTKAFSPRALERWWQLAALSVAQRAEDFQFLIGNPFGDGLANPQAEIEHLNHVLPRFRDELRFTLAQGIAIEWRWGPQSIAVFDALKSDLAVGAEARMRAAAVFLRAGKHELAIKLSEEVEEVTRDPYIIFLARYFKGQAFELDGRLPDAERAYRGAAAAVPNAQSASTARAAALFRLDRRAEAQRVADEMLRAQPPPVDPWRAYIHADDRFWPQLIARVRAGVLR